MFTKVQKGGCPYTATFLVHVDLFSRLFYELHWHKMEAANWNVIHTAHFNFQFVDDDAYYVNHMSKYEHFTRKKYGYQKSENMTATMANAAMHGECNVANIKSYHSTSLGLIPFYGARPPNVTANLQVKSLGQGNSLVRIAFTILLDTLTIHLYIGKSRGQSDPVDGHSVLHTQRAWQCSGGCCED
jgi:hypothetical protein